MISWLVTENVPLWSNVHSDHRRITKADRAQQSLKRTERSTKYLNTDKPLLLIAASEQLVIAGSKLPAVARTAAPISLVDLFPLHALAAHLPSSYNLSPASILIVIGGHAKSGGAVDVSVIVTPSITEAVTAGVSSRYGLQGYGRSPRVCQGRMALNPVLE